MCLDIASHWCLIQMMLDMLTDSKQVSYVPYNKWCHYPPTSHLGGKLKNIIFFFVKFERFLKKYCTYFTCLL